MVKDANPYLPEEAEYFEKRRRQGVKSHPQWDKRRLSIVKKSNFKCLVCEQWLKAEDQIELHHIKPKQLGGSDAKSNLIALHKQCHKQVTHTKSKELLARFKRIGVLDLENSSILKQLYLILFFILSIIFIL
jgi:5-methylcytosine-specific restriction endonuclease McrA